MSKRLSKCAVLAAILCLLCAGWLTAASVGSIQGTVKDASGAYMPGVKVTLINAATNAKLETSTDTNGEFQFLQVPPANYSLAAEAKGFKRAISTTLVEVDQITHAEFNMEVGDVSQSVQVEAAAPLLETDKSTLSSVVNGRTIANMPLNARQYLDLALITPGALPAATGTQGGGFNVSGARSQSNIFLLDGISNVDTQVNSALGNFRITDAGILRANQRGFGRVRTRHRRPSEYRHQERHQPVPWLGVRVFPKFEHGRG